MKKFLASFVFIVGFGSYALYNYFSTNSANASATGTSPITTTNTLTTQGSSATPANTTSSASAPSPNTMAPAPAAVKKPTGQYIDGTYTGLVADAYYGNVQVEATISGGRLTKVTFLQSPNDRGTSISINRRAMPMLSSEAIQAQSANVDGVSGASDTSAAFEQSLGDALSQAKA